MPSTRCPQNARLSPSHLLTRHCWLSQAQRWCGGNVPANVEQCCPTNVYRTVKVDDAEMQRLKVEEGLEVLKPELGTKPRVYYKNLHLMTQCFVGGTVVADVDGVEECAAGVEVTLKQAGREIGRATTDMFGEFKIDRLKPNSGAYEISVAGAAGSAGARCEVGTESLYLGVLKLAGA